MSGKSTLARSLAKETGAVLLSPALAIEWALRPENTSCLVCAGVASEQLLRGLSVQSPREGHTNSRKATMLLDIIKARIARADCQRAGWVLDGFPETRAEAAALISADLAPGIILSLEGLSNVEIMNRQSKAYAQMMDETLENGALPSQDVHSSITYV